MFRSIAPRELVSVFAIVVVAAAVGLLLPRLLPTVKLGENWLQDFRFGTLAPAEPQNGDVVVVAITEDTLATLPYRSPVDRGFLADLLGALEAAEPRAIGVDILFDQPTEPAKDARLRRALLDLAVPVVVASAGREDGLTKSQVAHLAGFTEGLTTAPVNLIKDRADGTVRWIFSGRRENGAWVPGFVPMLAKAVGLEAPKGDPPIVYRRGPDVGTPAFRTFPAHSVGVLPKNWFTGKIVLIGAALPLDDRHRTPFSVALGARAGNLPGVVIFAHAVAQLLDGRKPPTLGVSGVIAIVVAAAAVGMLFAMIDLPLLAKGLFHLGALAALWVGGFALYRYGGVMAPLLAPTLSFAASASAGTAYLGRRDRQQKRFIREAFGHYVSPAIVNQLVDHPEQLTLGGERRELTYLFTDLANFTSFTESTAPGVVVPLLNEYLDEMCRILFRHGATIDKIVGDAVIGFFNAPTDQADHPARAVAAAMEMDAFGQRFVAAKAQGGLEVGITRIGVHSGTAVIGNFGGEEFFDYTAHGDMVNTAARLEAVNKHLGTRVCVSGVTAARCPDMAFRPVGALVLKGKKEELEVFEPLRDGEADSPAVAAYREAFEMMLGGDPGAVDRFRDVVSMNPDDPLARLHLSRLEKGATGATIVMEEK